MRRFSIAAFVLAGACAVPALATPADDVTNALAGFAGLTSYHFTVEASGKHAEGDWVAPDKMQMSMPPMQMIHIGTTTWVLAGGHWMQLQADPSSGMTGGLSEMRTMSANPKDVTVTDLGPKTVDGETMHAYSVVGKGETTPAVIYVGSDGRVHRIEKTSAQGKTSIMTFSKFNQPVTIAPPQQ